MRKRRLGCIVIFIACCGVLSCCQHNQDPVHGVISGENSVATVDVFALVAETRIML